MTSILWFQQDLRLSDNAALESLRDKGPIIPLYIWSPEEMGEWAPGGASRWWLFRSLQALEKQLRQKGSYLILKKGPSLAILKELIRETGATGVYWNRRYEPFFIERDSLIKKELRNEGIDAESFKANLLFEPWEIKNKSDKSFQVFTPYWKTLLSRSGEIKKIISPPELILSPSRLPSSEALNSLGIYPKINHEDWTQGFEREWEPGELGGHKSLKSFFEPMDRYKEDRDLPALKGTSRLSPYLHWGEISPREVWWAIQDHMSFSSGSGTGGEWFLRELGWREFAHHLLYHYPHTVTRPLYPKFEKFPWEENPVLLKAWKKGCTGYPIVDAGLRELWSTGWMHNRVRMIVASFLIKDLFVDWRVGAAWFWDTLLDADLANNTFGWQWTAGCGADASPYFRVFNPTLQGEKFDPEGRYVRRWIPELEKVPNKFIHCPWNSPIKTDYPEPIVDHAKCREKALMLWNELK